MKEKLKEIRRLLLEVNELNHNELCFVCEDFEDEELIFTARGLADMIEYYLKEVEKNV